MITSIGIDIMPDNLFALLSRGDNTGAISAIHRGQDVHSRDFQGCTPIFYAAAKSLTDVVKALIDAGADPNARDEDQETVLMWAAGAGMVKSVDLLIKAGADVNASSPETGYTPLIWAAQNGDKKTVRALLAHGGNVNAIDKWGQTALSKALAGRHDDAINLL